MDVAGLQREVRALRRQLAEAEQRAKAVEPGDSGAGLRFEAMVERIEDGVFLLDQQGTVLYATPRIERILGLPPREIVGRNSYEFIDPEDQPRVSALLARLLEEPSTPVHAQFRVLHPDGAERWVEATASNFLGVPEINAVVSNFREITERKRAEESRNLLAAIVECSDDAIVSTDLRGTITSWNRGAERLLEWGAPEVIGTPLSALVPADLRDEADALFARVRGGESVALETRRLRKDGCEVEVALSVSPIRDGSGKVVGIAKIARDLTERRKAEVKLRRTEEQLRQAQKMEAIGVLAGGVAHDFNNLLSVILSYSSLLLQRMPADEPMRKELDEISRAGMRAADLTRQLLAFSRQQVLSPRVLDLSELVLGIEGMIRRLLGEDIDLRFVTPPSDCIFADPSQIEQLLMNLVVNARDAMPRGGKLTVEVKNVVLEAASGGERLDVEPGPYVMLAVTDTGVGMDAATRERIFEPFFTTKDHGKGTGLGLSMVFGIVKQSGGHISVYSEPVRGTTFQAYFPHTARSPQPALEPQLPVRMSGDEMILVVEDEEQVRAITCSILRGYGYTVIEAQNADEALAACAQHAAPIQLMVTDVVMPRVSGRELAERLALLRPDMRVLYVSGYTENAILHHGVLGDGIAFLQKPITPVALGRKVREVLDGPRGQDR